MTTVYSEEMIVTRGTNIELFQEVNKFITNAEKHIEKFPSYSYDIEFLGGQPGSYSARLIIRKNGNRTEKTQVIEGDSESDGIL